ncbi:MAG: NHLP leader peptide family RiPP precursor [Gammaproteobacteria bacterium]|nr:NHLP leader peptide family RiPP precursor [Gammaproteobacteria bacterium]MDE0362915.1 NHLP leader peptide family RiPP precursor [Rhodospirillaceae bacterium]
METQASLQQKLIGMAEDDGAFRKQLLDDPRTAIQEGIGVELPGDFNVVVHEDDVQTAHLVLPPSAEMTDAQLGQVVGGAAWTGGCG